MSAEDEPASASIEAWIESVLIDAMANGALLKEKVAAANVAVRYLAVKHKIGVPFGEGLDEE